MTDQKKNTSGAPGKWLVQSERAILSSPVMTLVEQACRSSEGGKTFNFYLLKSRDWCNVIPVTEDGKVVMVRQYRIGTAEHTLEVPGGATDTGAKSDEDPQAAALRELEEETGYAPLPGARCEKLGWTHPNPAILDNRCHSFIVGPVRRSGPQKLDEAEMIDVVEVPIAEIPGLIARGEISHALMLNAFLFAMISGGAGSALLADQLSAFSRA